MKTQLTQQFSQPYISAEDRKKTVTVLEQKIKQYEAEPGNRDGRGVRHQNRKQVHKTTGQLKHAFRHRESHPDSTIRHAAAKLIRRIPHLTFEELADATSAFWGTLCQNGIQRSEKRRQEGARIIPISNSLMLKEVRSLTELVSVGKTLENCVSWREVAQHYMHSVERGRTELWKLLRDGQVYGIMRIFVAHKSTRSIEECSAFDNENAELSHDEAMEVLRKLQITNSDVVTFASVGAYPAFLHNDVRDSMPDPIEIDRRRYFVWRIKKEIIVATTDKNPHYKDQFLPEELNWSRFREGKKEFRGKRCNFLSKGRLLKILYQSPEFLDALKQTRPTNQIGMDQSIQERTISSSK